jgi:hypothetical protein
MGCWFLLGRILDCFVLLDQFLGGCSDDFVALLCGALFVVERTNMHEAPPLLLPPTATVYVRVFAFVLQIYLLL